MQKVEEKIVGWIKEQVKNAGCQGVIIGLSGGVDSSVVGALCKKAFPDNTKGMILPCHSNSDDEKHAKIFAENFSIDYELIDLSETFKTLYKTIENKEYDESKKGLEIANIKPRLRMTTLYYYANKLNYLVVGTDNKSESCTGYFTKHGDGGVDILPISDLLKRDVRKLAAHLGVPDEIISKPPSAGLWMDQTDEEEMGITYDVLDKTLDAIEKEDTNNCDPEILIKVKKLIEISEHKRQLPPMCELN